jgi:hypothetical protein
MLRKIKPQQLLRLLRDRAQIVRSEPRQRPTAHKMLDVVQQCAVHDALPPVGLASGLCSANGVDPLWRRDLVQRRVEREKRGDDRRPGKRDGVLEPIERRFGVGMVIEGLGKGVECRSGVLDGKPVWGLQ